MKSEQHRDKVLTQYNDESGHYDAFHANSENNRITNTSVEKILKKYKVKSVLDMTCGTGSQVFWLAKYGDEVTGQYGIDGSRFSDKKTERILMVAKKI